MTAEPESLRHFKKDVTYSLKHQDELLDRYAEQWVAIFGQKVVAADPNFETLLATLRQKGVPPEHALVRYFTRNEDMLIV